MWAYAMSYRSSSPARQVEKISSQQNLLPDLAYVTDLELQMQLADVRYPCDILLLSVPVPDNRGDRVWVRDFLKVYLGSLILIG